MEIDTDKIDEAVLALLYLTLHDGVRAWKGHDWDALDRLHRKGMRLFRKLFAKPTPLDHPTARQRR